MGTLKHGLTITKEFCGQSHARYVIRQYGKWTGMHFINHKEAKQAIQMVKDGQINVDGSYINQTNKD